jgi:hypothetical protein
MNTDKYLIMTDDEIADEIRKEENSGMSEQAIQQGFKVLDPYRDYLPLIHLKAEAARRKRKRKAVDTKERTAEVNPE